MKAGQTPIYLQAFGGAETVTGSKLLLGTPSANILIDCGLFQGLKSLREKNWHYPPFEPSLISHVMITHAHLDHTGYIPLLVKYGYRGPFYMSGATSELCELILRDSAKLQEEDAYKANKYGYTKHQRAKPLYGQADVERAVLQFVKVDAGKPYQLNKHITFQFYGAGHIPGACSVQVSCYGKNILFSGDIGRSGSIYLSPPSPPKDNHFVVMESTYGDRLHQTDDVESELASVINRTVFENGNLLIPCFAVGRAQELIQLIYRLKEKKSIPPSIPVFLDSPMAAAANHTLLHYPEWTTLEPAEWRRMLSNMVINKDAAGTSKIIKQRGSKIILAGSGMLTGGRALEYLKHYIEDKRNTILIIGFQAAGTRGRALLNGAPEIKIHGRYYTVRARVEENRNLSAHADQHELVEWLEGNTTALQAVFLNHGEPCALEALRIKVRDTYNTEVKILQPEKKEILFVVAEPGKPDQSGQSSASHAAEIQS